jgi:endonuclease/exonuclease/phosphatase family metal-dependent hydrolase
MRVGIGTFNLNNLFSRFNFEAEVDPGSGPDIEVRTTFTFTDPSRYRLRTSFTGGLVEEKPAEEQQVIASRLNFINAQVPSVLAVQEVENIEALREFSSKYLVGSHHLTLVEGNDPRLIDVGIISKWPIGAVTSWQHTVHPDLHGRRIFSRDLLEIQVLNESRTRRLFTVFNTHLKSHFVPFNAPDIEAAHREANLLRMRQAESMRDIISARTRPDSPFVITGDMNDPPDSEWLAPLVASDDLSLTNALQGARETRPPKPDTPPAPADGLWTHRFKPAGAPAHYELFDHIWLSDALIDNKVEAWIDRRTTLTGDGSDHDPAWVVLDV